MVLQINIEYSLSGVRHNYCKTFNSIYLTIAINFTDNSIHTEREVQSLITSNGHISFLYLSVGTQVDFALQLHGSTRRQRGRRYIHSSSRQTIRTSERIAEINLNTASQTDADSGSSLVVVVVATSPTREERWSAADSQLSVSNVHLSHTKSHATPGLTASVHIKHRPVLKHTHTHTTKRIRKT